MINLIALFCSLVFNTAEAGVQPVNRALKGFQCYEKPEPDWAKIAPNAYEVPEVHRLKGKFDRTIVFVDQDETLESIAFVLDPVYENHSHSGRIYNYYVRELGEPLVFDDIMVWFAPRGVTIYIGVTELGFLTVFRCPELEG